MAESRWNEFWGQLGKPIGHSPREIAANGGKEPTRRKDDAGNPIPWDAYDQWGHIGDVVRYLNSPSEIAAPASVPATKPVLTFAGAASPPAAPPSNDLFAALDAIAPTYGGTVTSATRSPGHNAQVGGVGNSYHLTGMARDLVPPAGMTLIDYANNIRKGMPGWDVLNEGDHIHVEPGPSMHVPTRAQASPWTMPQMQAPDLSGALSVLQGIGLPRFSPLPTNTPEATSPKLTPLDKASVLGNFDAAALPNIDPAQFAAVAEQQKRAARLNPLEGTVIGSLLGLLTGGRGARVDANSAEKVLLAQLQREVLQANQKQQVGQVGANVDVQNNATVNQQATNDATVAYQNALAKYNATVMAAQAGNANQAQVFQAGMQLALAKAGVLQSQAVGTAEAANQTARGQTDLNLASINAGVGPAAEAAGTAGGAKAITREAGNIAAASGIAPNDPNGSQAALGLASGQDARVVNSVAKDIVASGYGPVLLPPATWQALMQTAMPKDANGKPLPSAKVDQKAIALAAGQALAESMAQDPASAMILIERAAKAGVPSAVAAWNAKPQVKK